MNSHRHIDEQVPIYGTERMVIRIAPSVAVGPIGHEMSHSKALLPRQTTGITEWACAVVVPHVLSLGQRFDDERDYDEEEDESDRDEEEDDDEDEGDDWDEDDDDDEDWDEDEDDDEDEDWDDDDDDDWDEDEDDDEDWDEDEDDDEDNLKGNIAKN